MSLIISQNQASKALKVLDAMRGTGMSGTFLIPNDLPNDNSEVVTVTLHDSGEIDVCVRCVPNSKLNKRREYPGHDAFYVAHFD